MIELLETLRFTVFLKRQSVHIVLDGQQAEYVECYKSREISYFGLVHLQADR